MALTGDAILKHAGVLDRREVHVPKWADADGDDVVLVRGMTMREFELHQARIEREAGKNDGNATARMLARCIINDNGTPVFRDDQAAQIAELPMAEVTKLSRAVMDLSGLTEDEAAIEGNSAATQDDGATSS